MANHESRKYLALAKHNKIDEMVLNWLVKSDRIPKDVELRAHVESKRRGGDGNGHSDHYSEALNEAVMAALNGGEPPAFLNEPYPDLMTFYEAGNWSGPPALSMIDEDFHRFGTLYRLAEKSKINPAIMYTLWHRVITEIDPAIGAEIVEEKHKSNDWYHRIGNICIKDPPAYEVYLNPDARKRLRSGIGERAVMPFGYLLADNHPKLLEELVDIDDKL